MDIGASLLRVARHIKDRVPMEQEKTRLEAQDAGLRDEMRTKLNFSDIIGELRSAKNSTAVSAFDANRVRMFFDFERSAKSRCDEFPDGLGSEPELPWQKSTTSQSLRKSSYEYS